MTRLDEPRQPKGSFRTKYPASGNPSGESAKKGKEGRQKEQSLGSLDGAPSPFPLPHSRFRSFVFSRQKSAFSLQQRYAPYLFVSPFLLLFAAFGCWPILKSLILHFGDTTTGEYVFPDNPDGS